MRKKRWKTLTCLWPNFGSKPEGVGLCDAHFIPCCFSPRERNIILMSIWTPPPLLRITWLRIFGEHAYEFDFRVRTIALRHSQLPSHKLTQICVHTKIFLWSKTVARALIFEMLGAYKCVFSDLVIFVGGSSEFFFCSHVHRSVWRKHHCALINSSQSTVATVWLWLWAEFKFWLDWVI